MNIIEFKSHIFDLISNWGKKYVAHTKNYFPLWDLNRSHRELKVQHYKILVQISLAIEGVKLYIQQHVYEFLKLYFLQHLTM